MTVTLLDMLSTQPQTRQNHNVNLYHLNSVVCATVCIGFAAPKKLCCFASKKKMLMSTFCVVSIILITAGIAIEGRMRTNSCRGIKNAKCVNIWECSFFVKLTNINPRPTSFIIQVKNNLCGFADADRKTPKVCCPGFGEKEFGQMSSHKNFHLLPVEKCGPISYDLRITRGFNARPREFPWMALIAYKTGDDIDESDFKCGGSLINDRYVLTAAHCLQDNSVLGVRLGEHNIQTEWDCDSSGKCEPPVQDLLINKVLVHPQYNPKTHANDIALIRLATPANLTYDNVKPICLPYGELLNTNLVRRHLTVTGWGVTETGHKSFILNKVSIRVNPLSDCIKLYEKYNKTITKNQICAGGYQGRDSCSGDSGGPLQYIMKIEGTDRYIQFGIVSYGPTQCGIEGQPAIYTNVKEYMTWILNNLEPDL